MRTFALQTPSYAVKKIKPQNKTTTNTNTNTSDFYGLDADTGEIKFMGGHQHLHDAEHDISAPNRHTQRDRMTRARLRRTGSRCQRPPRSAPAPWSSTRRTTIEQQGRVWGVWHSCTCSMSCGLASVSTVCADFRLAASQHGSTRRSCRSPLLPGRTVDTPATHVPLNMHVHRHRR